MIELSSAPSYEVHMTQDHSRPWEPSVQKVGREILKRSRSQSVFQKNLLAQKMMDWAMRHPPLKVELFRFVDVLPALKTKWQIAAHLREYFLGGKKLDIPFFLKTGLKFSLTNPLTAVMAVAAVKQNVSAMANVFIAGEDSRRARGKLEALWDDGYAFTVDILGEAVVSEDEAREYQNRYLELVSGLAQATAGWQARPFLEQTSFGGIPRANVSVKCSSLYSQIDNQAFDTSVRGIKDGLRPILNAAVTNGVFINIDMEQNDLHEITLAAVEEIFLEMPFKDYLHLGIVAQAYLKDAMNDLKRIHELAKKRASPLTVRLVKGAYWDYEVILARQSGWPVPVFTGKKDTDANYEDCAEFLLGCYPHLLPAFGSHNVRSVAFALACADHLGIRPCDLEVQMLFGMAGLFKHAIRDMGYRVREYVPVGEMIPGMAYLVRRLLENTSNESFLRAQSVGKNNVEELLKDPRG